MVRTVYIDLLFLINFSMDFLCFYLASAIMSVKLPTLRGIAAAVLGGIYSCVALFIPSGYFLSLFIDLCVCFLLCAIAFGKKNGLVFSTVVYFSVSIALGGFMTALFNLLNRLGFSSLENNGTEDGISVWLFALLALVSAVFTLFGGRFFKRNSKTERVSLKITEGGKSKELEALVDSGNLLHEPISGRACIMVDTGAVRGFFDNELISAAQNERSDALASISPTLAKKVRLISTLTATGERMLIGIRADKIEIDVSGKKRECDAILVLSQLGGASVTQALVPPELLN